MSNETIALNKEAIELALQAYELDPMNDMYKTNLHQAYNILGIVWYDKARAESDLSEKIVLWKEAVDAFSKAHDLAPDNELYKTNLHLVYNHLGASLRKKSHEESDVNKKIVIMKEVVAAELKAYELAPENDIYKENLHLAYNCLGYLLDKKSHEESDVNEKIALMKGAVDAFSKAYELAPENDIYKTNLHRVYNNLGFSLDNKVVAECCLDEEIVLQKEVVAAFLEAHKLAPDNESYKTRLHQAYDHLGNLLCDKMFEACCLNEEIALWEEVVDACREAHNLAPENEMYKTNLHQAYNNLGVLLCDKVLAEPDLDEKIALMKEAVNAYMEARDRAPENEMYKTHLHRAYNKLGNLLYNKALAESDSNEKVAIWKEAVAALLEAHNLAPENELCKTNLHQAYNELGVSLSNKARAESDSNEKVAIWKEAVKACREACNLAPENVIYKVSLWVVSNHLECYIAPTSMDVSTAEDVAVLSGDLVAEWSD